MLYIEKIGLNMSKNKQFDNKKIKKEKRKKRKLKKIEESINNELKKIKKEKLDHEFNKSQAAMKSNKQIPTNKKNGFDSKAWNKK